jgi:hypothetical protein
MHKSKIAKRRKTIFDAIVARVLELGMETDHERAATRAKNMIDNWTWTSDNSVDERGHMTIHDWIDPELGKLLDADEFLKFGIDPRMVPPLAERL